MLTSTANLSIGLYTKRGVVAPLKFFTVDCLSNGKYDIYEVTSNALGSEPYASGLDGADLNKIFTPVYADKNLTALDVLASFKADLNLHTEIRKDLTSKWVEADVADDEATASRYQKLLESNKTQIGMIKSRIADHLAENADIIADIALSHTA